MKKFKNEMLMATSINVIFAVILTLFDITPVFHLILALFHYGFYQLARLKEIEKNEL